MGCRRDLCSHHCFSTYIYIRHAWDEIQKTTTFEETEATLTSDLRTLGAYFRKWRLKPNPTKTETSCFHLCNKHAERELQVHFEDNLLHHNPHPKYLGITLDRKLSYRKHLENTAAKLRTRNNILHKLCGTSWGSSVDTLRTSAIGLVYSASEYGAPVWLNSAHTHKVDVQLNVTMRTISGTLKSTPTSWLPVLSHISPPDLRRKSALVREFNGIQENLQLPIHRDLAGLDRRRLPSRRPSMRTARELRASDFNPTDLWEQEWREACPAQCQNLPCIGQKPPAYEQPCKIWSSINRIRTGHGRCADSLHKWNKIPSARCDCGAARQTVHHIITECRNRAYGGDFDDFLMATKEAIEYICQLDIDLWMCFVFVVYMCYLNKIYSEIGDWKLKKSCCRFLRCRRPLSMQTTNIIINWTYIWVWCFVLDDRGSSNPVGQEDGIQPWNMPIAAKSYDTSKDGKFSLRVGQFYYYDVDGQHNNFCCKFGIVIFMNKLQHIM